jgi:dihydrofolate synthase / folylpolyglutamate synthase
MALPRTPQEALAFLAALPASVIKLGLERVEVALESLGRPERRLRALHVAGTNGKGSTCAFASSVLRAAGYRVGLYTSPHLERLNERFRVNGEEISDELLGQRILQVLERYPQAADSPPPLTYFELGTLVAFWHFAQERVDVAVLETGLGGRLDATNTCQPLVTALTPISFDHMELLGNTLAAIAGEKAGIIKPGVPAVVSRQPPEALAVFEQVADRVGAPLLLEGKDFSLEAEEGRGLVWRSPGGTLEDLRLGLRGAHQRQNAAVALAAVEQLGARGLPVPPAALREGLREARWPGRLEELGREPLVLLEGAHNPGGVEVLLAALRELYAGRRIHCVFGVVAEKDSQPMMRALFPECTSLHLTPLDTPRSLAPERYLEQARALCSQVHAWPSLPAALDAARAQAAPDDLVLCTGSLFLVGAARALVRAGWRSA